jgi:DNA mismatch repair ATPase MutS
VSAIPSGTNSLTFYMEEGEDVEEEDEELTQQEPEEILVSRLTHTSNCHV